MRPLLLPLGLTALLCLLPALAPADNSVPQLPAPEGAQVYFITPQDGASVGQTFTVRFGLKGMGVAPAGLEKAGTGHHRKHTPLNDGHEGRIVSKRAGVDKGAQNGCGGQMDIAKQAMRQAHGQTPGWPDDRPIVPILPLKVNGDNITPCKTKNCLLLLCARANRKPVREAFIMAISGRN